MLLPPFPRPFARSQPALGPVALVPALDGADPRQLAPLVAHTDRLRLPPGRVLALAGASARELVVIVSGEAVVLGPGGSRAFVGADTEIGFPEVLTHERHAATVMTVSDVEVVVVAGPAIRWAHLEGLTHSGPGEIAEAAGAGLALAG
jgi:CRP-like cAMP-binding protein